MPGQDLLLGEPVMVPRSDRSWKVLGLLSLLGCAAFYVTWRQVPVDPSTTMAMAPALSQRMGQQLWNAEAKAIVAGAAALRSRSPGGSPLASQGYMTGVRLAALDGARAGCRGNLQCVRAVGLFFGTQTGKTEDVASAVGEAAGVGAEDIGEKSAADLAGYDGLIVGLPTWNTGADSERSGTAWDEYLEEIKTLDLCGKPVAVFGVGDSVGYGDNFCDAIEELHNTFQAAGAKMIGYTDAGGYQHSDSKSVADGKFLGLPLDEDNENDMTKDRVTNWVSQLKSEGMPL